MNSGEFTAKINTYLLNEKKIDYDLLYEASKRCRFAFSRQLMEGKQDSKGVLRMSSGGQCARKQWYSFKGEVGEPLNARTINTFLTGDLLEVGLSILGRLAGWNLLGKPNGEQAISIEIQKLNGNGEQPEDYSVFGHVDDILDVDGVKYLIEYKSMSEYSYRKFEKEGLDDSWGYMTQASLYCEALGIDKYILVGQCKNTGHICDHVYSKDESLVSKAKDKWRAILNIDEIPERGYEAEPETKYNRSTKEYDSTGRSTLSIQCQYCQFKQKCWEGKLQQEFKEEKPVWIVQ